MKQSSPGGMAGEGSELGYTFEQLGQIIGEAGGHPGLGVCLDTCHMTGAGYDLADISGLKKNIRDNLISSVLKYCI
jgi:deoxyribonuclease-4